MPPKPLQIEDMLVDDLHAVLAMPRHLTVREALAGRAQAAADYRERQRFDAAYQAYVDNRAARRRVAIAESAGSEVVAEYDRDLMLDPDIPMPAARRHDRWQSAAEKAAAKFDARFPLLDADRFHELGEPAVYEAGVVQRTANRVRQAVA